VKPTASSAASVWKERHAAALPVELRDHYLRSVADSLRGNPTDTAVEQAINVALDKIYAFINNTTHS
jgi:hypothetical protein